MHNIPAREKSVNSENKIHRDPRHKYLNQTQLLQGVAQVDDSRLSQGECLFLLTLAAFTVRTFPRAENYPHPGNQILMATCRITTRKGVNYLANQLVAKQLIEIVEVGNGRGKATVYRIRVEDTRFPWPKNTEKPGSSDFPVSEINLEAQTSHLPQEKPGSKELETRKYQPRNPEVKTEKPGSLNFHTDSNPRIQTTNKEGKSSLRSPAPLNSGLPPETQHLVAMLEFQLRGEMSGWESKSNTPEYRSIRKCFEDRCADLGIFSKSNKLYEQAFARVKDQLAQATLIIPANPWPVGPIDAAKLAEMAATDPDCIESSMDGDIAVMRYRTGQLIFIPGEQEPAWHPFDDPVQNSENCEQNLEPAAP